MANVGWTMGRQSTDELGKGRDRARILTVSIGMEDQMVQYVS